MYLRIYNGYYGRYSHLHKPELFSLPCGMGETHDETEEKTDMNDPLYLQKICSIIGKEGCYLCALAAIARLESGTWPDLVHIYRKAVELGYMRPDCYINGVRGTHGGIYILYLMTGLHWNTGEIPLDYVCTLNQYDTVKYAKLINGVPDKEKAHFVLGDGKGGCALDSLESSQTVATGVPVSRRLWWVL